MVSPSSSSPPEKVTRRHHRRRAKSARIGDGSCTAVATDPSTMPDWRDRGSLAFGPAMLIADRVLAADVADYVRFRAVCSSWRGCTADPRGHALDPRFHPRRWVMKGDVVRSRRGAALRYLYSRFVNPSTTEQIRMTIRGLNHRDGRTFLAPTARGLLVLLNKKTDDVWVVNPITGAWVDLPPVTTLLHNCGRDIVFPRLTEDFDFTAELTDDLAVVINMSIWRGCQLLGIARPGDERWTEVECKHSRISSFTVFAGRVYCMSGRTAMVLQTSPDHPPRVAKADEDPFNY